MDGPDRPSDPRNLDKDGPPCAFRARSGHRLLSQYLASEMRRDVEQESGSQPARQADNQDRPCTHTGHTPVVI